MDMSQNSGALGLMLSALLAACSWFRSPPEVQPVIKQENVIVFHNGTILTMEDDNPSAKAILIIDDKIAAIGDMDEVVALANSEASIIDLKGRTILPGFIDSHSHRIASSIVGGDYKSPGEAIQAALEQGWTGLHELDINEEELEILRTFDDKDQLRLRVAGYWGINSPIWEEAISDRIATLEPTIYSPYLRVTGAKIFMDLRSEYHLDQGQLSALLPQLHDDGWQIAIEAIESQTLEMVLNVFQETLPGSENRRYRHRIEHAVAITDDQVDTMVKMGMIASVQLNIPASMLDDANFHDFIKQESACSVARWRDLIEAGVPVVGSTDFPALDFEETDGPPPGSPIRLIYQGVTRTWGNDLPPQPWILDQKITVAQALRLITINAAYVTFEENTRGSLAPGKLADLVILSGNPLTASAEEFLDIEVLVTMVGGKFEWCSPNYESLCPTTRDN